jgi:hypothetical protein
MRNHQIGIAFAVAFVFAAIATALSCSPKASARAKLGSQAAKDVDSAQARDLAGVWMQEHPRPATVLERSYLYEFTLDEPPMTDWGKAQYQAARSSFGTHPYPLAETNDPVYRSCAPPGLPRIFLHPFPMQIVQTPGEVIMLFEYDSVRHQILPMAAPMTRVSVLCGWETRSGIGRETLWLPTL